MQVFQNPPSIEVAKQITTAVKTAHVVKFFLIAFIPYFIAIVTFHLYKLDHDIKIKKEKKIEWGKLND